MHMHPSKLLAFITVCVLTSCLGSESVKNVKEVPPLVSVFDAIDLPTFRRANDNTIVSFVSPSCEHCHYQTQALLEDHVNRPSNLSLIFFATDNSDSGRAFSEQFVYDTTTTIFAWDEGGQVAERMGVNSYPTMFLYDSTGTHLETIVGEAKPAYVYKFFHEPE